MPIRSDLDGHVRVITLDRPERHNALDDATSAQLEAALAAAYTDDSRVILLRGAGRSFCSGRDVAQLGHRAGGENDLDFVRRHQDRRLAMVACPKPIVAAVRGYALGGGLELALAADIRIAATDAQLAFPEVRYGLMTDTGGSAFATVLAGPSRAKLLAMTGRRIDAAKALAWSLVDEIVPPEELDQHALDLCHEIAAHSPSAVAMIKQVVDESWHATLHATSRAELLAQVALFASPEYLAAKAARSATRRAE